MILSLHDWKRIARIGYAASTDPLDGLLEGIRLRVTHDAVEATATDRFVIAQNVITVDTGISDPWEGVVRAPQALHVEKDIRSLDRYRSKKEHPDETINLRVVLDGEWIDVTVDESDALFTVAETITRRLDLISGDFPDTESILSAVYEPAAAPATVLNAEKVAQIAKTVADPALRIQIPVLPGAVRFSAAVLQEESEWRGRVMPMRSEDFAS